MFDGIIFDIDGTLWDSRETVVEAWNEVVLRKYPEKKPFEKSFLTGLFGKTMSDIANALFPELEGEELNKLADECFEYENQKLYEKPGIVYPKVKETLQELSENYPLFIVSNCQKGYVEVCMHGAEIEEYITAHLCYGDTQAEKWVTIRKLMEEQGLQNPIYVGDTQGDYDSCCKAEIPMIYVSYGLGSVAADIPTISGMDELPEMISKLEEE